MIKLKKIFNIFFCIILTLLCTSCAENGKETENFIDGYGNITDGAYSDGYTTVFFEDDVYIYYGNYKINKTSKQWLDICETPGCTHESAGCLEYDYAGRLFPGYGTMYYIDGKKLYSIDQSGNKALIDEFKTDSNGIALDDSINIELIRPINTHVIYVMCSTGSCIYNIETGEKIYVSTMMCVGDEDEIYYYESDEKTIFRLSMKDFTSEPISETENLYPYAYANGKIYCNTEMGAICSIDGDNNIEVCMAEEGMTYKLLGICGENIYYLETDMDIITGTYTINKLCVSTLDFSKTETLETQEIPSETDCFYGGDSIYLLESGEYGNVKSVYTFNFETYEENIYYVNEENDDIEVNNIEIDSDSEEMSPVKQYALSAGFYTDVFDELTGITYQTAQENVPFEVNNNKLETTFYYSAELSGYPEEGYIKVFALCDGIMQKLSVDGNEYQYINQVKYENGKGKYSELQISLENHSENGEIIIGYYLADSVITDDFDEFQNHNETVSYNVFEYETEKDFDTFDENTDSICPEYDFDEVYSYEVGELYDDVVIYDFAAVSDTIPIKLQSERWNMRLGEEDACYVIFHSANTANYMLYILLDDEPIFISDDEMALNVKMSGEYDTLVFDMGMENIISDNEKHIIKLMAYNQNTNEIELFGGQIIQIED